jgi:hypothetical protein
VIGILRCERQVENASDAVGVKAPTHVQFAECREMNGRAFGPLTKANTHKRNFVFSPWAAGNPCSPRTDGSPYIRHTPTSSTPNIHIAIASAFFRNGAFYREKLCSLYFVAQKKKKEKKRKMSG